MKTFIQRILALIVCLSLIAGKGYGQTWYSQLNSSWSGNTLGTCTGKTVYWYGCAMTSVCMLYNGTYNPGTLNSWLTNNGGYSGGCDMKWNVIPSCQLVSYDGSGVSSANNYSELYSYISVGKKAVVNVHYIGHAASTGYDHWVLVTGFTGTSASYNVPANYTVYDPGYSTYSARTLASYGSTGFRNAKYYSIFNPSSYPLSVSGACGLTATTEVVHWSAVNGAVNGYEFSLKKASSSTWWVYNVTGTGVTITGLSLGTNYNVRIRAKHCGYYGAYAYYNFSTGSYKTDDSDVTSIADETIPANEISLYPNPAAVNSPFTLTLDGVEDENVQVNILSVTGQIISSENFILTTPGQLQLKTPDVQGMYLVNIVSEKGWTLNRQLIVTE